MKATARVGATSLLVLGFFQTSMVAGPPQSRTSEHAVQVRLGGFFPQGDSSFWDETTDAFTINSSDFDDVVLGFTFVHSISNGLELAANIDFYEQTVLSEYRDFVDGNNLPILHDTTLVVVPLTFDVRFIPGGRYRIRPGGRQVMKPVFYIGAGAGIDFWSYEEVGDFLSFPAGGGPPDSIFFDVFEDDGTAFEAHLLAGFELPVSERTHFLVEGRYSVADDDLGGDFAGLDNRNLDLSGTSVYAGLSFRY